MLIHRRRRGNHVPYIILSLVGTIEGVAFIETGTVHRHRESRIARGQRPR